MELELYRSYFSSGCNGTLLFNKVKICATIELPWKNNQSQISCIPEGKYRLAKRYSPHLKWHLHVLDVTMRDLILIHPANNAMKELKGCIAPVPEIVGEGEGISSVQALEKLKLIVYPILESGVNFYLTIKKIEDE